ncbi:hypothetical protein LJR225_004501 [Phenylobacterium sp. LjRoot225]|uniref:hypothetical protein n=1 Tax=Phenylobacterium sp. LjRoot225 TaxID=3342285 RepID=UPI003ECF340A
MRGLDWVLLAKDAVSVGDLVSADAGGLPIYRVMAVADGKAWLQDERRPAVQVMPLDCLRWKAANRRED